MNKEWLIQIVTLLSVVAGAILVILELRQVQTLSRAQLSSDAVAMLVTVQQNTAGDDLAVALEKACLNPDELTLKEAYQLDSYYMSLTMLVTRMYLLSKRDEIYDQEYWKNQIGWMSPIFRTEYGRNWFNNLTFNDDLKKAGNVFIEESNFSDCASSFLQQTTSDDA